MNKLVKMHNKSTNVLLIIVYIAQKWEYMEIYRTNVFVKLHKLIE